MIFPIIIFIMGLSPFYGILYDNYGKSWDEKGNLWDTRIGNDCYIAIENSPVEIVDFRNSMVIFQFVNVETRPGNHGFSPPKMAMPGLAIWILDLVDWRLEKYESMGRMTCHIWNGKIKKNVPNHQPDYVMMLRKQLQFLLVWQLFFPLVDSSLKQPELQWLSEPCSPSSGMTMEIYL